MLTGRTPRDRYEQLMARATRAHRKPKPVAFCPTRGAKIDHRLTEAAELKIRQEAFEGRVMTPKQAAELIDGAAW